MEQEQVYLPRSLSRRLRYRVAAGIFDFFGIVLCTALIIGLLAALINLYSWLRTDLTQTFSDLTHNMTDAVLIE